MADKPAQVKCVIWDLDGTVWEGTLTEGGAQALRPGVADAIRELDRRGIIQSVASKNDASPALKRLEAFGLADYFLCPQISWGPKSGAVQAILDTLNLKPEAVAFVDDSPFERDEVRFAHPKVRTYDAAQAAGLPQLPECRVRFITQDSANRRKMYQADLNRQAAERDFGGSAEEFLATLGMRMEITRVTQEDLQRVEELTVRTHQLNSTGYTYSYEQLLALAQSPEHIFCICGLQDRYGDSGKVGLLLLERQAQALRLKLLIVSCRVMTRGIGSALLAYATQLAQAEGKALQAEFLETEHNRIMYITYKLAGFDEVEEDGANLLLEYAKAEPIPFPPYLAVQLPDAGA
ncbi:MAG TPA: HAD-IIIC family phosphatase [Candidatus Enterenecus merdae]|nr:HAD-IIIC family phosphatase [Candidatus Enterenecus merdae]